jgi:putative transposase
MPRFFAPGVPLHVIQRGNNRQAMFGEPADRAFFLALLRRASDRYGVSVHAYVLMTNHVHLLSTPQERLGIPRLMQSVGRDYVRWFNDRRGRTGTLWEGRYRATVVDDDRYLLTCMRYIELNPVRAGIADRPGDFRWSSFRVNASGGRDRLVRPHPIYLALGRTPLERASAYGELFAEAIPEEELGSIRDATHHGWALGSAAFVATIDAAGRRAARLPKGRPRWSAA